MTEILYRWLDEELRISVARDADTFLQQFSNGQLIGRVLQVEGVLPDKKFDQLRTNDLYEDRLHNFLVIGPYLKSLGVNLSVRQARDILSDKPGSLTYLIYQVYLALHKPRDHLRQPSPEPLPDAYKERLRESAKPDLRDSGVTSLGLTCQCYGRDVTQTRITEGHLVKECQQRITKEGVRKKARAKEIQEQMTEEYMKGDSAKLWGRSFRSTIRSAARREKDRQRAEAAAVRQQIEHFDNTADLRRSKYEDVRNAEFLQTTVTPDMIPEALVNTEANQQFVHKLRNQLDRDTRARFDREKRRKQMYLQLRDQQRQQEEEQRELDLVRRLLRQGDYELRLAAHLTDIKRQKQIIIRNRLEKDRQMQERRQEEYERSVQQQMDLLGQKRMEHQEELLKESQLHRRLLQQRRDQKAQRRWQLAADVVTFCLDMAVLTVDYKTKSGDKEVPALLQNDWRELFLRGESLSGGGEPTELSATSVPAERQQALLQQHDLDDYLAVSGRWVIPGTSGKKRSASAQAKDDSALRVESAVVTGFVVHRLLRLVYPPKPSVQAPDRPTFTLMGAVMGKSYAGKTHCLKWVQTSLDVRHIVMHDLVKRSLAALERETQLELEAAGSGVMETLRIADILGTDQSNEDMQRYDSAQQEHQRQETDVDTPEGAGESIVPDSATTAQSEGPSAPTSASDAPQADSAVVQEDGQKESGSQTKLKDQKSQESAKGFDQKPDDANKSGKSQKSAKSNGSESAEAQKQSDGSETNTPKSSAHTSGGSAEATRTSSNTKQKSSPSTKDITSAETDRSKMSTASIGVSDEATTSLSSDTVVFEYSRLAELGRDVKQALESGQEVQDQTLAGLLLEAWRELPDGAGWIIEGFPNTLAQAELLEEQLVGKQYDSDEELDDVEIVVTPLPKPEPPAEPVAKEKGKKEKKEKDSGKKGKKDKDKKEGAPPVETPPPSPPLPPPEPVRLRVKPFRRSQLVPDANRRERPPPTSGLDLVVELFVSDEVAQQRRCQNIDRVSEQPDSGNCQAASDDHVTLAGKLFSYGRLREPLVEFYSERDVYHMVEADDLAVVETQLEKLIGASREKQREEHRQAERRAEMLAAAENEPDSEPELIPEPEPEVVEAKGKGKAAKSPKGGKGSADKGKKGKGKGKGDAEPEPAAENLPQIPAPPPMPTPGEMGYYFVDAPVPEGVAQYLALLWQQTERNYTENLKQWLGRLRLEHAAVIHHLHAITVSFNAFLLRPDHKQQFLDRFVTEYNLMEEALRVDEEVKCEWHLRIQELESTIWNITDTRRCEAEQERYTAMTSGWIEDRLALSANNWLMVMQSEMDRFQDTCLVLEDYYVSMSGAQLPEVIGRVHGFKQAMIEIPSREPADRSGASSAGSDRHSGSRSSSSARPLRRGVGGGAGRGPDGPQSAGSAILTTINLPQLRPKVQFVRGKNQADEVTTAVEGVIDSACKSMMSFVHDTKDKGDARVKQALLPIEEAPGGKKGAKKAATPKPKGGKKGAAPEEDAAEAELSTHREWAERALAEFQVAAREESSRVSARLALIRVRAVAELAALRQRAVTAFHGMWSAIEERYRRELQAAAHMADYLRGLVEQQQRAHYQLLLDQDRFIVRTGVLTHLPCLPASPPPTEEALLRDRLSLLQATGLWRQLHTAAPSGIITTRAFCFILQDLVACGVGTQELPALWMSLSQEEIESLSARIAAGAEVMSWRGLLYDLLEPWTRPDQFDLHEALAIAHVFDPQRTSRITREEALQVLHWMKPHLEELDEAYNRPYHTKRLLVDISGAPGDETVDYQTLLTWLCRSDDVLQSFLSALTVLEDKPIFISNPEDDPKYYPQRKVDLNRIQSLPMQRTVTSPRPDIRSRKVRLTKSAPLNVSKDTDDEEGSEDTPKEVVLQATCSTAYHMQDALDMNRPPSQMVGSDTLGDRLGASLENLPSAPDSADRSARTEGSQPSLSERRDGSQSGSMQSGGSISGNSSSRSRADTQTTGVADTTGSADSARSQLLGELTISVPAGHTLDSWTELAPSCCTHPAEAPPTTPSTDERAVGETGNKSTLNAIRTVLARTLVLPAELMPQALQRLDLDLALVHRDLYGGACCATVEALRRDEPLPVPILAVFQHDLTQRYLAPGQCTLLAGRPWQIIKDIRSPPPQPPPPAEAAHAASVTGTGTSLSFKDPA